MSAPYCYSKAFGQGPAPALALHCGLGRGVMLRQMCLELGDLLTVTVPDLPGHGRSPPFPPCEDVHDMATEAMARFVTQPLHLIGHSFGATVALRLAIARPEDVLSLTLIEPVFFAALEDGPAKQAHRAKERAIFASTVSDPAEAARMFHEVWGGSVPWDQLPEGVRVAMAQGMGFVSATEPALWQDATGMLRPKRLERVTAPVTLIRGAETQSIMADVHAGLMARLPQATEAVIPGAGHMSPQTHATQVAAAIRPML